MRAIKFRAWDKEFKKFKVSALSYQIRDIDLLTDYEWMQYTGLKDINGVEIYEGDIVEVIPTMIGTRYFKGVVKFEECAFYIVNDERQDAILLFDECEPRKIVGNIYEDSKELLKYDVDKNI